MANELLKEIKLEVPKEVFQQDFLDIEVKKKYSIYGDELVYRMREIYQEDARNYGVLFTDRYIYDCRDIVDGKVLLIGHRAYWR